MFSKSKPIIIQKEQETRALVAFIDNIDVYRAAITDLDNARAIAAEAEGRAYEAVKEAELKGEDAEKRMQIAISNRKAVEDFMVKANEVMEKGAKALQEAGRQNADNKTMEQSLKEKETMLNTAGAKLDVDYQMVKDREAAVAKREADLQAKLDAFKAV